MTEIDTLTQTNGFSNLNPLGNGKVRVSGFMIHEGTYNDITFTKEALDQCVNSFVGKVCLKDHDNSVDKVVGEILSVEGKVDPTNGLYGLAYEADIDGAEEDLLRKMELGFIKSTSIGITSTKKCSICGADIMSCNHWFWDDDFQILATDIQGRELSIVAVPADKDASVGLAFSDNNFLDELTALKTERRTNMSDNFETKYAQVMDEFSQFKIDKADEITQLKESFKTEKEELEVEMAGKVEENLKLKTEIDTLKEEKEALSGTVAKYEEAFAAIEEEKLSSLREEVTKLNTELSAGLSEERISQLSEAALNEFVETFSNIKENQVNVKANPKEEQHYQEQKIDDDAAPIDQFMARLGL